MKNVIYKLSFFMILGAGACTKALDINQNPNSPVIEYMEPDHFLANVLDNAGVRVATSFAYSARWMGYWARSGDFGAVTDEESYNIGSTYQANQWSRWYQLLYDNHLMETKGKESGQPFYVAAAKVIKAIGFMYLVDQYNNIPYTQTFDLKKYLQPAYDKGEDIYKDLLKQLDTASVLFKDYDPNANLRVEESDIMFHGDVMQWRKLVNTQRLKLLIRMSQTGTDLSAELQKIKDDDAGLIGSEETAAINPGYALDANKISPFWAAHVTNVTGDEADGFNRANNFLLNLFIDHQDIRYRYVFAEAEVPLGGQLYLGYDFGDTQPGRPEGSNSSGVGGPGFARSASQDQWFFTSVESLFLQAEAVQRGWLDGDAKLAYEDAVRESFIWLNVGGNRANAVANANAYLNSGQAIVDWTQANTHQKKIELIIMQKYLAMVGLNNFEAWVDYRRIGVPAVPRTLYPGAGPNIPIRLRYPQNEYSYNGPNVEKEGNPNHFSAPVFWDK